MAEAAKRTAALALVLPVSAGPAEAEVVTGFAATALFTEGPSVDAEDSVYDVSMAAKKRSILAGRMGPVVWLRSGLRRAQEFGTAVGAFYAGLFSPALTCGAR